MTERVLVTGASGVVGGAVARGLIERGYHVRTLQRRELPKSLRGLGIEQVQGDINDEEVQQRACAEVDRVVHAAARVDVTGPWAEFERVNVRGTSAILEAANRAGVRGFVLVSSPSVSHTGKALIGADADPAEPEHARSHYSRSKAMAEQLVLNPASDKKAGMARVAVRPHLVWGPGDTQLTQRIIDRARASRLVVIGDGAALIDTTYIDNAADAIIAALERVEHPEVQGRAFVVSNGQPRTVVEMLTRIARVAGLAGPKARIPYPVARGAGHVLSAVWERTGREGDPVITPFVAEQLATAHRFDQETTRRALQWSPRVDIDEGFDRLAEFLRRGATT